MQIRTILRVGLTLLVFSVGWVWAGNAGAALGLLWLRTPTFANAWRTHPSGLDGLAPSATTSWFSPWLITRPPLALGSTQPHPNSPTVEMICADDLDAAGFARVRREWLGRGEP